MATEAETEKAVAHLMAELGIPDEYIFCIPDWEPVDAKHGLLWMTSQMYEGYNVRYRLLADPKRVQFKYWEYGEQEPNWEDVEYLP